MRRGETPCGVSTQGLSQVVFDVTQHLPGFMDIYGMFIQAVMVPEGFHDLAMHAGHGGSTEINGQTVCLTVFQDASYPFLSSHDTKLQKVNPYPRK